MLDLLLALVFAPVPVPPASAQPDDSDTSGAAPEGPREPVDPQAMDAPDSTTAVATLPAADAEQPAADGSSDAGQAGGAPQDAAPDGSAPAAERPTPDEEPVEDLGLDADGSAFRPGKGLSLVSKDGRFAMIPRLRVQFLYSMVHENASDSELEQELGEPVAHSLQIRRARLQFTGHVFGKHNKYKAEFAFSPRDEGFRDAGPSRTPILDWYAEFDYLRDLTFRIGQYKVGYSRQRVVSSGNLQMVDRSAANGEFNLDRDIGFDFRSKDFLGLDRLKYYAGVFMSEGRDAFEFDDFHLMYLARVEYLPFGGFKDYSEADLERGKPRLSIGAAYGFVDDAERDRGILGSTPSDGGTTDYHNVTADLMFKWAGFSLFGEFYWRDGKRRYGDATIDDGMGNQIPAPREDARNGLGWSVQPGYVVPRIPLEISSRYSQVRGLGNDTSMGDRDEVGGAISYYFAEHPLKLQADYFRKWDDAGISDGTDQVRVQLQVAF